MRKTRNLVPSGASVRIRPTSHDDHKILLFFLSFCLFFVHVSPDTFFLVDIPFRLALPTEMG